MNFRNVKFVFVIFVVVIVVVAIFNMRTKNEEKQTEEVQASKEVVYQDNLRLGVCNFDSVNPFVTRNKQVMDIEKLIYEPLLNLNSSCSLCP